jgi:hypothetical protein
VTSLVTEQFAEPDTARQARVLERARRRAADQLAGRTVWCLAAARTGAAAASALQDCLGAVRADGVAARRARLPVAESLTRLVERLDEMLRGDRRSSPWLGPEAREVYLRGMEEAEQLPPFKPGALSTGAGRASTRTSRTGAPVGSRRSSRPPTWCPPRCCGPAGGLRALTSSAGRACWPTSSPATAMRRLGVPSTRGRRSPRVERLPVPSRSRRPSPPAAARPR